MGNVSTITRLHLAPSVHFEPCLAFHADDVSDVGLCEGCGWSVDDHEPAQAA